MTTQQLLVMSGAYLTTLLAIAYLTRATPRRIAGAMAGGAVAGLVTLVVMAGGEETGWWRVSMPRTPGFVTLLYLAILIAAAAVYLVTWRIARRFGGRGLAVLVGLAAVLGPPRDYAVAAVFPEWKVFSPGIEPILGVAATYAGVGSLGHILMRLVAGPSKNDPLARRPWENPGEAAASRT